MVSCFISRLVILIFGTLYPAYASYKAVRTKNVKEYVKWMMYWIVFALFTCAETFTDLFLSFWFPFYYEIKIITVIYLLSPATKGSSILYRKFVHPVLTKREQEIDEYIAKAKEQGYHTMLNLGSKGVTYATSLIMQTAIKGGGGLVNQLKKSYSLSDLSEEQHLRSLKRGSEDDADGRYEEEIRRMRMQNARRTISGTSPSGLYYPEVDDFQHPLSPNHEQFYGQMPSSEDISSGYSSGDPLYYGVQRPGSDHLVRTASLGGTSRIRTRAASKSGLPKRSSLSEAGSTWSTMEPRESQIETDFYFNTPLQHSTSLPFSFTAFNPTFRPEFQYMLGNLAQPMFSFIDPSKYSPLNRNCQEDAKSQVDEGSSVVISEVKSQDDVNTPEQAVKDDRDTSNPVAKCDDNATKPVANDDVKDCSTDKTDNSETKELITDKSGSEVKDKEETKTTDDTVSEKDDLGDKLNPERSGKYKKKPAPIPPIEEPTSRQEVTANLEPDDVESEFCTPNSSPLPERKFIQPPSDLPQAKDEVVTEKETKPKDLLEVPVKNKSHNKKEDSHSKHKGSGRKMHLPKISFPFWNQKSSSKHSSGSESSSIASIEIGAPTKTEENNNKKAELEFIIPLKDDGSKDKVGDSMAQESSKQ